MPRKGNEPARTPTCHPERKHLAHGLCKSCYDRDYGARNREHMNAKAREWAARNPEKRLATFRRYRYGVTDEQVKEMRTAQDDLCAICRSGPSEHLDHDHGTKRVRGLLCAPCNRALGLFGDDPERLRAAAEYVERARDTHESPA